MKTKEGIRFGNRRQEIDKKIKNYRANQTVFVIGMAVINALLIAFLTIYYSIRQRALVGALYLYDKNSALKLIDRMMHPNISMTTLDAGVNAMIEAGYTKNGYFYLAKINGETIVYVIIGAIITALLIYGLIHCYRIGKNDCLGRLKKYVKECEVLKEQLYKEHEYSICQYRKMHEFVENISHQIKTPLSVMTMKLEMLQDIISANQNIAGEKEVKDTAYINDAAMIIDECTKSAFKIKVFIKKLLDISRIESGKVILASDKVVIDYIIEESVESAVADKSKIIVDYGNTAKRTMYADEGWLAEAFVNIISNSYEYISDKEDGRVYIDISSNNEVCIIKIADNGEGIDKEHLARIFDRFEHNRNQNEFHAGIGLNLSRLIIEAHHGSIKAGNSEKYGGAEFRILLPLYRLKGKIE